MKVETIEIAGFESCIKAMRLPMRSGERSDSEWQVLYDEFYKTPPRRFVVGPKDLKLLQNLILAGDEHSKAVRSITVWAEITGPWYFFNELDTYVVGTTPLGSTSSMHIDCKNLTGEALQEAKGAIRGDYEYTRVRNFNYQCLRRMYKQRNKHRLPEWRVICDWIKTLPLAQELICI